MRSFQLDPRLARDTTGVAVLGLCDLRLMGDRRWPWLVLVPQRNDITELHDLTPLDQAMLTFETALVAKTLKRVLRAEKINIGALGNIVAMFHMHVVARFSGDTNWPGPVWGVPGPAPYEDGEVERMTRTLRDAVLAP